MTKTPGKYIVIEGPEGVGKTTQIELLAEELSRRGYLVKRLREPDSQTDLTARAIRTITQDPQYPMNTRTEVLLYNAARAQSLEVVRQFRAQGMICLVDRSYLTTLAIQYYGRGDIPDYNQIDTIIKFAVDDMEPDAMLVLDAPVGLLQKRVEDRYQGDRFDRLDRAMLERIRGGYLAEAKRRNLDVIDASGPRDGVFKAVLKSVNRTLNQATTASVRQAPAQIKQVIEEKQAKLTNPYLSKAGDSFRITDEGRRFLQEAVTNVDGNVYAFRHALPNATIAAAMARLSRRGDDMRITLLDEFAMGGHRDEGLLKRVITAYGDDSVQQLAGIHLVVEGASNLLTKKLEWGRLAAYLEQSTRYIYFDQKDEKGNFKYYTPLTLNAPAAKEFETSMNAVFERYSHMVHAITEHVRQHSTVPESERDIAWKGATRAQACDAARAVLPVATKATVGIYASGQALENLVMHLLSDPLDEAKTAGQRILEEARQVMSVFLERADKPDRGGAAIAYRANTQAAMRSLVEHKLPQNLAPETVPVQLVQYWPKNELDLLAHMLYEHANTSLKEIEQEVASWSYDEKRFAFNSYIGERLNRRHKPGRALEQAHYTWDLLCDYGIFRDLHRHRMVDALEWQELTPRYGYDIPRLVEAAGQSDLFEQCFDLSYELYSKLQAAGYHLEAQYATLLGHKMRWKLTYNAREAFHLHELRTSPQGHPGYRKLVKHMHGKLAEVHPLLAEAMIFVNRDEDPELTRLAAERYTQFKLKQLEKQKS